VEIQRIAGENNESAAMRKRMTEKLQVLESGVAELTRLKKHHISMAETEVCALLSPDQQNETNFPTTGVPAW
jgi:hypothetical protein